MNWQSPGPNVIFTDPSQAVQGEVDKLTAEGVNKIIVLSHSGYVVDQQVAANTTGVDVIVGGHSNTYLSNTSGPCRRRLPDHGGVALPIVSAYAYGKFLGELNVTFNDAGEIVSATGEPIIMDAAVAEDEATKARITEAAAPLDEIRNKVVASAAEAINGERRRLPRERMPDGQPWWQMRCWPVWPIRASTLRLPTRVVCAPRSMRVM